MNKMKHCSQISLFSAILVSVFAFSSCNSDVKKSGTGSTLNSSDTASILFNEYEHDFGKISEGEVVACVFTFKNVGTGPLVLKSAVTTCGCTVSKYSTKPVPPGESGTLEVEFDSSGRSGLQTKTITVRSNASKPMVLLSIRGEVIN
jgi:hypothetical protein